MGAQRVVIVESSTGLGRSLGIGLAQRGTRVALLARGRELLDSAVQEAGERAAAFICDATDEEAATKTIDQAAEHLGGIDALVYSAGVGDLRRVEDIDAETWHKMFGTNVVGASLVTKAALPHLEESHGIAVYFSSVSASMTAPWPGLAGYTVTKAALDKLVEAWRSEHPEVGFTRLVVGECGGGEGPAQSQFTATWDPDLAGELYPMWVARGLLTDKLMDVEDFIEAVVGVLRCGATMSIPSVVLAPRRPI